MEPAATMAAVPVPAREREPADLRARRLTAARRRATALLAAVTALFVGVTAAGVHGALLGYVQAGAEAAMIGGIADWFAVTALFRRPLGLPIPHTALIVERKDQFAGTLGQFVQENFLNADVLTERIRSARIVSRLASWLAEPSNAARFAGHAADLAVNLTEALRDEDMQRVLTAEITRAVDAVEVAPLAGRALRMVIAGGHHAELFNSIVSGADRYLADHQAEFRQLFEGEAPRWVPDAVYRRVFDRMYTRLRQRLAAMAADPDDSTRQQFEEWIAGLPDRLETSPELRERGERLKRDILGRAELRDWSSSLWQQAKAALRTQAADPESELRRRLAGALAAAGRRLESDRRLQESLERVVESGTRALADQFHDELAGLVTGTIERWDAAETSSQLELLLGRDLQFIRINGTVVGAGVGLALHAVVQALTLDEDAADRRVEMPWFPEFASAVELARLQARAAGQADPVGQYFAALNKGDSRALETAWPGEVVVYDPRAGEVRGHRQLRRFVERNQAWLAARHTRTQIVASTRVGGRAVVELLAHLDHDGRDLAWPIAVVAESADDRSVVFRTYCSQVPVDGRRHLRPPVLKPGAVRPGDIVGRYQAALSAGDAEAIVGTFAPDGYYREPIGPHLTHRGAVELRSFFAACFGSGGGIGLEHCAVTDDGVRCALEYNCVRWGGRDRQPQAGIGIFERGPDGLLAAVRAYHDIEAPVG